MVSAPNFFPSSARQLDFLQHLRPDLVKTTSKIYEEDTRFSGHPPRLRLLFDGKISAVKKEICVEYFHFGAKVSRCSFKILEAVRNALLEVIYDRTWRLESVSLVDTAWTSAP